MPEISSKQRQFEETLTTAFDIEKFVPFAAEFINGLKVLSQAKNFQKDNRSNFEQFVVGCYKIGFCETPNREKLAVMAVCLKQGSNVEQARSKQRNYVKQILLNAGFDGAIVAFYIENSYQKWRLSFIRMDYDFVSGKVKEKLTPAKRFSYLVGQDEPCHTAKRCLYDEIYADEEKKVNLDDLEKAFSVEKVTDEFFRLYQEKFLQLQEKLEEQPDFVKEAKRCNFTSEQYAKKLMGQIVFLYFIQKKGWLGVEAFPSIMSVKDYKSAQYAPGHGGKQRDIIQKVYQVQGDGRYKLNVPVLMSLSEDDAKILAAVVKSAPWGTGPKNFVRTIFNDCLRQNKRFLDDYLEPFFYTGLNQDRGIKGYYHPFHRCVPFLNGGLFEELEGYDWRNANFNISNEVFSNVHTKGDRDADGILDIFDRYNFTMNEDEPMEREVAIDPEMLGKVFENLLEVKDRKSKGAFYTPREIVHYMCQESLVNYLTNKMNIPEQDIRDFVLYGELMKDEDTKYDVINDKKEMLISSKIYDRRNGVNRLTELDNYLAEVKICDPAVGSGAFPMGLINEIVRARDVLTYYLSIDESPAKRYYLFNTERSHYRLKTQTIKNSIFACDIEPSAVDIAKLRLWLSIVIDDEISSSDDLLEEKHTKPRQLPNLDCNIICGNSLMDEFMGIKLVNGETLFAKKKLGQKELFAGSEEEQIGLFEGNLDERITELMELQDKLFFEKDSVQKQSIKAEVQNLYNEIILEQLGDKPEAIEEYFNAIKNVSKPFVIWQLCFPRVFALNGGFDIVIGNPPYVQLQKTINDITGEKLGDQYEHLGFETFTKTGDIYCLFYEKGYHLLRNKGIMAFITSNKWMRAGYGKQLRNFFVSRANPLLLIDMAGIKVFDTATVDTNILLCSKEKYAGGTQAVLYQSDGLNNMSVYVQHNTCIMRYREDSWAILNSMETAIKKKIELYGIPLKCWDISINYGVKTGCNEAFIIDKTTKDMLISKDKKSAELIRPILRGRDIKRYGYEYANLFLICTFPSMHYDIEQYPAIKQWLSTFGKKLEQTGKTFIDSNGNKQKTRKRTNNKWFETQDSIKYWDDFNKQKIVYPETTQSANFYLDDKQFFLDKTCFFIIVDNPYYLQATLSSKLFEYAYKHIFSSIELGENGYQYNKHALIKLPVRTIASVPDAQLNMIKDLVSKISNSAINEKGHYVEQLDEIIFNLYNIGDSERNYIISSTHL